MTRPSNYDRDEAVRLITTAMLEAGHNVSASQLGTGHAIVRWSYSGCNIVIAPSRKEPVDESWRKEYNKGLREARLALRANYPQKYDMLYSLYKDNGILSSRASGRAYNQLAKLYPVEWKRLLDKYTKDTKGAKNGR